MADNDFRWGQRTYTLREFLDSFTLPRMVKVTAGHYGNTEVESLAAGQIVRIHRQVRQLRVIAEDRHGRRLSIPADRKGTALFDVISGSGNEEFRQDIVHILQTYRLPLRAQFSREIGLRSTDRHGVQKFGELNLLETYEETYLQGNSYTGNTLVETVLLIPMYLTLRVAVADGLQRGGDSDWSSLCQALSDITANTVSFDDVVGNDDVSLYTKTSVEEHNNIYDEIEPARILKVYAMRDPMSSDVLDMGKTQTKELKKAAGWIPTAWTDITSTESTQQGRSQVQHQSAVDKPSADSYQTLTFGPGETCYQGLYMEAGEEAASTHRTENVPRAMTAPVTPRGDKDRKEVPFASRQSLPPTPAGGVPTAVVFASPAVTKKDETTGTKLKVHIAKTEPAQGAADPSSTTRGRSSPTREQLGVFIETFSDIPKDVRTLNIAQMADCLRLLKLDKYIATFEENMVDGDLLMDLDRDMMRADLHMSPLDCVKLLKFRDEGWRPKDQ
ncbi:hypothetical protein Bbelb_441340 [Branchiostoma belcheri]|nr:hypothetical protein Bbelb_441340 [Branchiostoma belcheri]